MRRQLRATGGITNARQGYGFGSWVKERVRKIIPNELADIAVKAAPFVAPFYPGYAAAMRGIGRFDKRGSMSDALKQAALTYAGGKAVGKLGGAEGSELGNVFGRQKYSMENFRGGPLGRFAPNGKISTAPGGIGDAGLKKEPGVGFIKGMTEATIGKVPILEKLPPLVQQQLLVGGITAGASALASFLSGDFRPQEPGESIEEYLAARKESVGKQMRTYMDNYFTYDPEYSALDDAGKDAFVARYNKNQGGRVGYQAGRITDLRRIGYQAGGTGMWNPDKTLVSVGINPGTGTPEWMYPDQAAAMGIYPTMDYEGNKITEGTPTI